jgi:hypothetical protein
VINHTSRGVDETDDDFKRMDVTDRDFSTLPLALAFLKEQGYASKDVEKVPMYIDTKAYTSKPKQIGWIFTFINSDISHASEKWVQQDWVEIFILESKRIDNWKI